MTEGIEMTRRVRVFVHEQRAHPKRRRSAINRDRVPRRFISVTNVGRSQLRRDVRRISRNKKRPKGGGHTIEAYPKRRVFTDNFRPGKNVVNVPNIFVRNIRAATAAVCGATANGSSPNRVLYYPNVTTICVCTRSSDRFVSNRARELLRARLK